MPKLVHDLRLPEDRLMLGRALAPLIETFKDDGGGRAVPVGGAWHALEDLRRHLEQGYLDRLQQDSDAGLLQRLLAKLTGGAPGRAHASAEDHARFQGYREALRALLDAVAVYVHDARLQEQKQVRAAQERVISARPAPGSSPM